MNKQPIHISIKHLNKAFFRKNIQNKVLSDITIDVTQGEFVTFFGPNGCGKSTLLNIIAGIEKLDSGDLVINSNNNIPKIGYVFQDYRGNLMPWLTVAENIAFPLKVRGISKTKRLYKVKYLMDRFGFDLDLDARTYTLSGGQAQLTSIMRALIIEPDILIMDEPFSALDYQTNLNLYDKVIHIWKTAHVTTLLVSHDIDEALYLGERTVFLTKRPSIITEILQNDLTGEKNLDQLGSEEFSKLKKKAIEIFRREAFL